MENKRDWFRVGMKLMGLWLIVQALSDLGMQLGNIYSMRESHRIYNRGSAEEELTIILRTLMPQIMIEFVLIAAGVYLLVGGKLVVQLAFRDRVNRAH